jgi:glycosyltransferase involved in cell wall biosynthesis
MKTIDRDFVNVTFFLDTFYPMNGQHFVKNQSKYKVVEVSDGTEAGSFLKLLDYITGLPLDPETIVYIVEDDYLHRPGWIDIILEGFSAVPDASYLTLYDHRDKYFYPMYENLQAKLYHSKSCHWRTTPSTTNTYIMKFKTLLRDLSTHRHYSLHVNITEDHNKFCDLGSQGKFLISPIPGWSAHIHPGYLSPCIDWEAINNTFR